MAALVTSREVESAVRNVLTERGYELSIARNGETGADIIAKKGDDVIHVEAIAFKTSPPARAKDFYESFFRAVSRIAPTKALYAIALPARFGMGVRGCTRCNSADLKRFYSASSI
jgi:hypothetical protein